MRTLKAIIYKSYSIHSTPLSTCSRYKEDKDLITHLISIGLMAYTLTNSKQLSPLRQLSNDHY